MLEKFQVELLQVSQVEVLKEIPAGTSKKKNKGETPGEIPSRTRGKSQMELL